MKLDEFAFANRQLAGMLKSGIPLESGLRQLCATMQQGALRTELAQLEADLAKGIPLKEALAARRLPELYGRMLEVGVRGQDLPGVLTLLADYYERANSLWVRLTGLMVYPVLVLALALAVSVGLRLLFGSVVRTLMDTDNSFIGFMPSPAHDALLVLPSVLIAAMLSVALAGLAWTPLRRFFRWRLPGFKEASLAMLASAMHLMLKQGGNLNEALSLARQLEQESPVGQELDQWQSRLASGHGTFQTMAGTGKTIPPLFVWLVANSGEDPAAGFRQAAELYFNRAAHKIDLLLYTALPVSILVLGFVILAQMIPFLRMITSTMNALGSFE